MLGTQSRSAAQAGRLRLPKLRRPSLRGFGYLSLAVGIVLMTVPGSQLFSAIWQENQLTQQWVQQVEDPLHAQGGGLSPAAQAAGAAPAKAGSKSSPTNLWGAPNVAFAIRVPKLGYYAAVRQGVSLDVLFAGPGHYPTTAMPGKLGNVGVAAHNTYWIAFGNLKPGDTVILETRYGNFTYKIYGTQIVSPDNTTVLAPTPTDHRLTLTTCWPLWAGALATQRLAIFGELTSKPA